MKNKPVIGILIPPAFIKMVFNDADLEELKALGECRFHDSSQQIDEAAAIELLRDATVAIGTWGTPGPSSTILETCPNLKLWEHVAGSVRHFFGPHLQGKSLVIASCAPAIADSVAEMTVGQIIMGLRRLVEFDCCMKEGRKPTGLEKVNLFTAKIGIVGASQVGRRVAKLLQPFGCEIKITDPFLSKEEATQLGAELEPDLLKLFAECQAVTLHTPHLPSTRQMIRAEHFAAMADHSIFVNTSRGECVDQPALIEALKTRPLRAFIDVLDHGEDRRADELKTLPNCFLTPHIAGGPNTRMGALAVSDTKAFLSGKSPLMAVSASDLDRLA